MADPSDDDSPWLNIVGGLCLLWAAYYLHGIFGELESGQRESARMWWGFVLLYKSLGHGITVFITGGAGAWITWSGIRKIFSS